MVNDFVTIQITKGTSKDEFKKLPTVSNSMEFWDLFLFTKARFHPRKREHNARPIPKESKHSTWNLGNPK